MNNKLSLIVLLLTILSACSTTTDKDSAYAAFSSVAGAGAGNSNGGYDPNIVDWRIGKHFFEHSAETRKVITPGYHRFHYATKYGAEYYFNYKLDESTPEVEFYITRDFKVIQQGTRYLRLNAYNYRGKRFSILEFTERFVTGTFMLPFVIVTPEGRGINSILDTPPPGVSIFEGQFPMLPGNDWRNETDFFAYNDNVKKLLRDGIHRFNYYTENGTRYWMNYTINSSKNEVDYTIERDSLTIDRGSLNLTLQAYNYSDGNRYAVLNFNKLFNANTHMKQFVIANTKGRGSTSSSILPESGLDISHGYFRFVSPEPPTPPTPPKDYDWRKGKHFFEHSAETRKVITPGYHRFHYTTVSGQKYFFNYKLDESKPEVDFYISKEFEVIEQGKTRLELQAFNLNGHRYSVLDFSHKFSANTHMQQFVIVNTHGRGTLSQKVIPDSDFTIKTGLFPMLPGSDWRDETAFFSHNNNIEELIEKGTYRFNYYTSNGTRYWMNYTIDPSTNEVTYTLQRGATTIETGSVNLTLQAFNWNDGRRYSVLNFNKLFNANTHMKQFVIINTSGRGNISPTILPESGLDISHGIFHFIPSNKDPKPEPPAVIYPSDDRITQNGLSALLDSQKHRAIVIQTDNSGYYYFELRLLGTDNRTQARAVEIPNKNYANNSSIENLWNADSKPYNVTINERNTNQIIIDIPAGHPQGLRYLLLWADDENADNTAAFLRELKFPKTMAELAENAPYITRTGDAIYLPHSGLFRQDFPGEDGHIFYSR